MSASHGMLLKNPEVTPSKEFSTLKEGRRGEKAVGKDLSPHTCLSQEALEGHSDVGDRKGVSPARPSDSPAWVSLVCV